MKDLKHLYEFEKLLESANNALVQQACAEGKHALAYTCYHMPEVLLNTGNCFSVRLRAPLTGSLDISSYYMSNFICDYCKSLLERGIEGGYNFLSGLMGTETCSEMNRALEHFELLRLVDNEQFFVTFLDMPFKVTENTVRHYVDQLRRKVLTPLLLIGLAAIIIKGIVTPLGTIAAETKIDSAVVTGVKSGYQTMDALAALPFGIIVLQSVTAKGYDSGRKQFRVVGGAAVLAGVLLLCVYMGLAYLGATVSAQYTSDIGRAQLIMALVEALMGKVGVILFGVVVGLACVTTAIALTSSAAAYFAELCRGKVSYKVFVIAICVFSAVVSNLGLDRIVAVAAPVLDVIYPPTLVLIFISLLAPRLPDRVSRGAAIGALLTSVLCALNANGIHIPFMANLPLYDLGLSWLLPAVIFGLAASLLSGRSQTREARVFQRPHEEL
mgnify:CR=1 FL=1